MALLWPRLPPGRRRRCTWFSRLANIKSFDRKRRNQMVSRRGFIRVGAATVGSLALRPFGMLPALAQSGSDYRALVCVFLFGVSDSNNMIVPMDDVNFKAYTSIRESLALTTAELTPTVSSTSNAPYAFHA